MMFWIDGSTVIPKKKSAARSRTSGKVEKSDGRIPALEDPQYISSKQELGKIWDLSSFGGGKSFAVIAANLETQYLASLKRITANDIAYVIGTRGDRCIRWFQKTTPPWAQALVPQLRLLLTILRDTMAGRFKMSWKNMAAVTSTLLYIGNPLDALPNSLPEVGYLDDALIVALCIAVVRRDLRRYMAAGGVDPAEVGL